LRPWCWSQQQPKKTPLIPKRPHDLVPPPASLSQAVLQPTRPVRECV
jgi:hypothetical protein